MNSHLQFPLLLVDFVTIICDQEQSSQRRSNVNHLTDPTASSPCCCQLYNMCLPDNHNKLPLKANEPPEPIPPTNDSDSHKDGGSCSPHILMPSARSSNFRMANSR